jgi:thiol-disulfide isomerase/thioredoxin
MLFQFISPTAARVARGALCVFGAFPFSVGAQARSPVSSTERPAAKPANANGMADVAITGVLMPPVTYNGPRPANVPVRALDAWMEQSLQYSRAVERVVTVRGAHYPKDSLRVVGAQLAAASLQRVPEHSVAGLQHDPYGILAVVAKQDARGQQQFAARLAAPGLSTRDRAYTLAWAVRLFADADQPERLPVAEQYLAQLDALGPAAAYERATARKALIGAYYLMGRRRDVARVGVEWFALASHIPFPQRASAIYDPGNYYEYAVVIDALSSESGGRARIQALNAQLHMAAAAPPEYVAHDPYFRGEGERNQSYLRPNIAMSERIGEQATSLSANYWVNRGPGRDSQSVAVNDGKIRLVEIGSWTCTPCIAAVPALERLHQRFPQVEFNFMTAGVTVWGNRQVSPSEGAKRLADHFVDSLHATFPIGIAMPTRLVELEDGGQMLVLNSLTGARGHYPQTGKPTFYVIDGKGIIRTVIAGYGRWLEEHLAKTLESVLKEGGHDTSAARTTPHTATVTNPPLAALPRSTSTVPTRE